MTAVYHWHKVGTGKTCCLLNMGGLHVFTTSKKSEITCTICFEKAHRPVKPGLTEEEKGLLA